MENKSINIIGDSKIVIDNLYHGFSIPETKTILNVLNGLSFQVKKNEILCIVGPNGCGKSTLLRIIAGLLSPLKGDIYANDTLINSPSPNRILLFQELYLFYWMTVRDNIEFVFEASGISKEERHKQSSQLIDFIGLEGFENYYPHEISGGMKQRLALARALAAKPSILLLDEPFSSLDDQTRQELEVEFLNLHKEREFTTIIVTHDIRQAVYLGDRVLVLSERPSIIKAIISIPFTHPRSPDIWQTEKFHELEVEVSNKIKVLKS